MQDKFARIHEAIVKDDVKSLKALLDECDCRDLAFGRFPMLSVAYLHDARKVIKAFSAELGEFESYQVTDEYPDDYVIFKNIAGKALRLYSGTTVSPADVAALKGYSSDVKKLIAADKTNTRSRSLRELYRVKENRDIGSEDGSVRVPRGKTPPLAIAIALVIIIVALTATGLGAYAYSAVPALNGDGKETPYRISGADMLASVVKAEEAINCELHEDITLTPSAYGNFKLNLDGKGHNIYINGTVSEPLYGEISGALGNVNFIFDSVDATLENCSALIAKKVSGTISDVTVTVKNSTLTLSGDSGIVAYENTGIVTNVTADIKCNIKEVSGNESASFGCLFGTNSGKVANSDTVLDITATGDASGATDSASASRKGDFTLAGAVGTNNGSVSVVTVSGTVTTSFVDVGGIVASNGTDGTVTNSVNNANITQTTDGEFWNPNVAGIAFNNAGKITSCRNNGALTARTTQSTSASIGAVTSGITATNEVSGSVYRCTNDGILTAEVNNGAVNVGGIVHQNLGIVEECVNNAKIVGIAKYSEASSEYNIFSVAGGIVAENYSKVSKCISKGDFDIKLGVSCVYLGGIVGYGYVSSSARYTSEIVSCGAIGSACISTDKTSGWLFAAGVVGYFAGNLRHSYGALDITIPDIAGTVAGGICGAIVNDYIYIENCVYLASDSYKLGVSKYVIESIFGNSRTLYDISEEVTAITAYDTLDKLKSSEVYWE